MENENEQAKRKPGPVPGIPTERYQLLLETETAEWAKRQPGGLSETVRALLREAYDNAQKK